ncbi:Eco57I restriction-modification methylase domain-containing protein [Corynebacterium felinum]|uniref:site-specific DNA-methyltransferase (adenine-specific) n=1 Tax=Corynebacterium felinum TaxID=131318 RepID=A0ABU2B8S0_9CORY|nr:Eco57I restriction-modification methylase domain-containing protein [Corynebacterium felinum]MDF5820269.1 Eco57I restriction-modification methylase domain-containing protein [Corynebacterium felinum]MDR7355027.1 hypothetical protein [Corynebacterium felinum]WJY94380.1 Modification methylase PaeR7I [Corynebacterium felinum]
MTDTQKNYGEVFTRRWVVEAILDLVGYTIDKDLSRLRVIEPAVGGGAFIGPLVERLIESANRHGIEAGKLRGIICGWDLQESHVRTSRIVAQEALATHGVEPILAAELAESWIHEGDFLLQFHTEQANIIVGNPPYIRSDDLEDHVERQYRALWKTMAGRADIYVGFYECALSLLAAGGKLGFICADRWMRNAYGKQLRHLVTKSYAMESVWSMHDVDAFEAEVSAYPAITVIGTAKDTRPTVIDTTAEFNESSAREALAFVASGKQQAQGGHWEGARLDRWFDTDDFWPSAPPATILQLEELQQRFPALGADESTRVGIGVATGADGAYIVNASEDIDVEPDRLLPLVMADDIRSGQLNKPKKVMLNPWDENGNLVDPEKYPQLINTLEQHDAVKKRYVARKTPDQWFKTIDKVRPGLAQQPKLLLQDMKAQITPVFEPGGYYPHHNLYYIVSETWDMEVLGGILLSHIAEAFISAYGVKMRGGTLRFQAQYLRKIALPNSGSISPDDAERLRLAFRAGDREAATRVAERLYEIPAFTFG